MTPQAAISNTSLLGPYFADASWERWKAVLGAAFGEALTTEQDALFREVADRDPPPGPVRELWCIAGRRAGKDSIASGIAVWAALGDYSGQLRPGERASVLCIASNRDQAKIVFRYIAGYFASVPLLRPLVERETEDTLELTNGVEIIVSTNSFRAVRGRSVVCVIFDECAFYRDETSAAPDVELYAAVLPAMATFKAPILVGISTPYRRSGLLFDKWKEAYGRPDPNVLVVRGTSLQFHNTLDPREIDRLIARDPERYESEYLVKWRSDLSDFLDREMVEDAVDQGVHVRPPNARRDFRAFCDPSGGRGDAFTMGIAHLDGNTATLDYLYERRAPFNPSEVVAETASALRSYGCSTVTGDRYAASWVSEAYALQGIRYLESERDRSQIYLDALPIFTTGRIRLLDNPRLIHQLVSLERKTSKFGRDRVDHPSYGGSDDSANSACGALVLVSGDRRPPLVNQKALMTDGVAPPLPNSCLGVYASVAASQDGTVAAVYFCKSRIGDQALIMDFDAGPLRGELFASIVSRMYELAALCRSPYADLRVYTQPDLIRSAELAGFHANEVPERFHKPDGMLLPAADHIAAGRVRLCDVAYEKGKTSPFGGALDFRAGENGDDPLRRAAVWAIALALDTQ